MEIRKSINEKQAHNKELRNNIGVKLVFGAALLAFAGMYVWKSGKPVSPIHRLALSPNCDDRPKGITIDAIVLHSTVINSLQECIDHFMKPASRVSAHFVVDRDGTIVQCVETEKRAWHAGVSVLEGVDQVNNFSIGIEMVNLNDGEDPYPDEQYKAVASLIKYLRTKYTIADQRIVSHYEIALPKGRKSDPAGFSFDRLYREIAVC